MAITRKIKCDVCAAEADEPAPEAGWQGWGAIQGIALNGVPNPNLCPSCLGKVAEFIDREVVRHAVD